MDNQTSDHRPVVSSARTRWVECVVLGAVCALVIGIYAWSAQSGLMELWCSGAENTYYNLLMEGFRAGELNLKTEVPSGLTQLADPYDPKANLAYRWVAGHPLHDLSYYRGKLYLYFGVTPALMLFWPYAVLTGHYLLHKEAVVFFCALGFMGGVGLLWALWRRYFAEVGFGVVVGGTLALGLASSLPVLLQRSDVYEVPISCGYALEMLALWAIWGALHDSRRRGWWLAAGSLAYGLALGARPSLLFGAAILLVPVGQAWGERRRVWVLLLAASGPIVLIGLGLMFYNLLRFDNPIEFGQRYQLAGDRQDTVQHFSLHYLWFNFRVYFLEPARWSGRFPFMHDIVAPPLPAGHGSVEHPFGVLTNVPLVWLGLAAPLAWRARSAETRSRLRWFLAAVAMLFGIGALTLGFYNYACVRFEVEFLPALVLLAVIGILGLEDALAGRPVWRRAARWGWSLLLVYSMAFNLAWSVERHAEVHDDFGFTLLQRNRVDEAIAQLQKALKIQPGYALAHYNLGTALLKKGQVDEALAQFQEALELQPDSAATRFNLGLALSQKGQVDEAMAQFQKALELQPGHAEAHYDLGSILFQKGLVDDAIAHYQKALELQPDYAAAHNNLGNALLTKGQADEAIAHFQKAVQIQPDFARAHYNLGNALHQKGQVVEAIAHYQAALGIQPDFAAAHNNLGNALVHNGQLGEAVAHYQKALELQPDFPEAHYDFSIALLQAGHLDEAISQYREALRLRPDYAEASNSLAGALGMKQAPAKQPATPARP